MKIKPIGRALKAKHRGINDCLSGKQLSDNPYLGSQRSKHLNLSSWWEVGFTQQEKRNES
jgi:hypothetical protein